ncbi:MAG: thiolase family protein [Dehalococcoidales bacterium]|nr:thiolase family protein [Dehalococcoidales bacterium]
MRDVAVIGVGMHKFGQFPQESFKDLGREAIWHAIRDAGIDPKAINIAYVGNCYIGILFGQESARAAVVVRHAGLGGIPMIHVESGTASSSIAFHEAVNAVASGNYDVALAVGVEKLFFPGDPGKSMAAISTSAEKAVGTDMGLSFVAELAQAIRALMDKWGWTQEQMAKITAKNLYNASLHPYAEVHNPLTVEQILAARVVAYPLTRPMSCSAAVDGGSAAIVCAKSIARRFTSKPLVDVAAIHYKGGRFVPPAEMDKEPGMISMDMTPQVFKVCYEKAGIGPKDVEIAQCHDAMAPEELLAYQTMGFCAPGEEGKMIDEGRTTLRGDIPMNTDGGLTARGNPIGATGLAQVAEIVWQLRGEAGARQVAGKDGKGPKVGAIQNAGGGPVGPGGGVGCSVGIILKR